MSCRSLALTAVALAVAIPWAPAAAAPGGTLIVTDKRIDTTPERFEQEVKASAQKSVKKGEEGWKIPFVAYLRKAPGAEEVNVVFYEPGQKREPVYHYPLRMKATAKILVAEVDVRPEEGFKAGVKYNMLLTRLIKGREEVYARTTIELTE